MTTSTTTRASRDSLIDRIRKLSAFTTDRGCSEAEALSAAAKIAELMALHDINETDLSLRAEASSCLTDEFIELNSRAGDWSSVASSIARYTHTRVWQTTSYEDPLDSGHPMPITHIRFFGTPLDVAAALALTSICYSAIVITSIRFNASERRSRKRDSARSDFRMGMAARLTQRLQDMIAERDAALRNKPTGTSLIILKDQLVTEEFAKLNLNLNRGHRYSHANHSDAYRTGYAAGSHVDLGARTRLTGQRKLTSS